MNEIFVDNDSIYLPDDYYDARYRRHRALAHSIFIDMNTATLVADF